MGGLKDCHLERSREILQPGTLRFLGFTPEYLSLRSGAPQEHFVNSFGRTPGALCHFVRARSE